MKHIREYIISLLEKMLKDKKLTEHQRLEIKKMLEELKTKPK